jgi:hypothetical protein
LCTSESLISECQQRNISTRVEVYHHVNW